MLFRFYTPINILTTQSYCGKAVMSSIVVWKRRALWAYILKVQLTGGVSYNLVITTHKCECYLSSQSM